MLLSSCLFACLCVVSSGQDVLSVTNPPATKIAPATTTTPATTLLPPGTFEIINSGIIPLKAKSSCSHVLTSLGSTTFNLKVTSWKPNCIVTLFTDEPRLLAVKVAKVPSWLATEARSILGKSTRLARSRRTFNFENSNLEISQTSSSIKYYYYAEYYKYKYSTLDITIEVVNKDCNKLVKMSHNSSGSIIVHKCNVKQQWQHCEIWAKSPMGSPITIKVSTACNTGTNCYRGQVYVDTEKGHSHMFNNVGLICPKDMPVTRITEGCSGGVFFKHFGNYLAGVILSFSTT